MAKIEENTKTLRVYNESLQISRALIGKLSSEFEKTKDSLLKLSTATQKITVGFEGLNKTVKTAASNFLTFEGVSNILGLSIGGQLMNATMKYNKTLFELSQQAKTSGRSFSEMKMAIQDITKTTGLAEDQAAEFFHILTTGSSGLTVTRQIAKGLAADLSTAFGPSMEDVTKGTKLLLDAQSKIPTIMSQVEGSIPVKEFDKYLERLIYSGQITKQTADGLSRLKRAHMEGTGALSKEAEEIQKLEKIKQDFEKGFRQFLLAVGKPLSDLMKNFGTAAKPVFEYINKFLKDKDTQNFIGLLMKGGAITFAAKMVGGAAGGIGSILSGLGMLKKKQDVNIDTISGMPAAGVLGAGQAGKAGGSLSKTGGLGGIAGRLVPAGLMYAASSKAGEWGKEKFTGETEQDKDSRAKIDALSGIGKGASVGFAVGGVQGGVIGASIMTLAEGFNQLSAALGGPAEASISFAENVEMAATNIGALLTGGKLDQTNTLRRREAEEKRDIVVREQQNKKMVAERYLKLSKSDKEATGIDQKMPLAQQQEAYYKKLKEIYMEKGGKEGDLGFSRRISGKAGDKEGAGIAAVEKELFAKEKIEKIEVDSKALAEARLNLFKSTLEVTQATVERIRTQTDLSLQWGDSLDNVLKYSKEMVGTFEKQRDALQDKLNAEEKTLTQFEAELNAAQAAEQAAKREAADKKEIWREENSFTQDRMNAEIAFNNQKKIQEDLTSKIVSLENQRRNTLLIIKAQADAEVQANKARMDYEIQFGGSSKTVNNLISENLQMYQKTLSAFKQRKEEITKEVILLSGQAGQEENIAKKKAEINRLEAMSVELMTKQNTEYENANKLIATKRSIVDAEISLEEANMELNKSINGGLGATLEMRSRLYEKNARGIKLQEEELANLRRQFTERKRNNEGTADVEEKMAQAALKRTQYIQKQVELTKSLRDGYLDALMSFQQVEGTFSKIIMTRESGLGEAMRKGMAAQGFSAGALGGGTQGPIFKRNPDGSITVPTNEMLHNVWKGMEKNYDPTRPNVLGVESTAAGAMQEMGLVGQFTQGGMGVQSPSYGKVQEGNGSSNIMPDQRFQRNNPAVSPEAAGRSLNVEVKGKEGEAQKAAEAAASPMKTAMQDANSPVVERLDLIHEDLKSGLFATGNQKKKADMGFWSHAKGVFSDVQDMGEAKKEKTSKGKEANMGLWSHAKGVLSDIRNMGEARKENISKGKEVKTEKSGENWWSKLVKSMNTLAGGMGDLKRSQEELTDAQREATAKGGEYSKAYRQIIATDAMERQKIWKEYNKVSSMDNLAKTMNTSGVGGRGVQVDQKRLANINEAERRRDRDLEKLDTNTKNTLNTLKKSFDEGFKQQNNIAQIAADKREMDYKTNAQDIAKKGTSGTVEKTGAIPELSEAAAKALQKKWSISELSESEAKAMQEKFKPKEVDMSKYAPQEYLKESTSTFLDRKQKGIEEDESTLRKIAVQKQMLNTANLTDAGRNEISKIGPEESGRDRYRNLMKEGIYGPMVNGTGLANLPMGEKKASAGEEEQKRIAEEQLNETKKGTEQLKTVADHTAPKAGEVGREAGGLDLPATRVQSGGWVGGSGSGDRIPAMLEPGEFVVNKKSAAEHGGLLRSINSKKYAEGGPVGSPNIAGTTMGGPRINFNIRGDSAKQILSEANKDLASVLNDMMGGLNASARYYDLPKSG